MNPFEVPPRILVCPRPQDMRAGAQRLASVVKCDLGEEPADGSLYVFVSRNCRRAKMLRVFEDGYCLWCVTCSKGCFKWEHDPEGPPVSVCRRELAWLLDKLPTKAPQPLPPAAARKVL